MLVTVGLPVVQAIKEALLGTAETLMGEATGEVVGEVARMIGEAVEGAHGVDTILAKVLSTVGPLI